MHSCIYCGEAAQCFDHVIPRSYLSVAKRTGKEPGFKVPSCIQCNSILGARIFRNLVERKEFVHKRLFVKLKRYVSHEKWEDHELKGLGRNLRSTVEIGEAKADIAEDRLEYSAGPPEARWLDVEDKWRALHEPHEYADSRVAELKVS